MTKNDDWVSQFENVADNIISRSTLKNIKALSIAELVEKCLQIYKLHKPKSRCTKILKFFLGKIGI